MVRQRFTIPSGVRRMSLLDQSNLKVIQPILSSMRDKLRECRDVEDLRYTHTQYTASLQYQCLLNEKVLRFQF